MENDICSNYHKGNTESAMAYEKTRKRSGNYREQILQIINDYRHIGGITCEQIEYLTGWKHQTVSARISELKRDRLIYKAGLSITNSGCKAAVYQPRQWRQLPMFE